jgi:hypothetical protein
MRIIFSLPSSLALCASCTTAALTWFVSGVGMSANTLYHCFGILLSSKRTFIDYTIFPPFSKKKAMEKTPWHLCKIKSHGKFLLTHG